MCMTIYGPSCARETLLIGIEEAQTIDPRTRQKGKVDSSVFPLFGPVRTCLASWGREVAIATRV